MKILEKIVLVIYSYIVLALAIITSLIIFGWIDSEIIGKTVMSTLQGETISTIILIINIIFIILSIKCIFFGSANKEDEKNGQGVLLQNESGKLMISKETIESLVNTIITGFESVSEATSNIFLNKENNLVISLTLNVGENVIIKELSANLQEKIKTVIKDTLDLDVKEVNIKIKNYVPKKESIG